MNVKRADKKSKPGSCSGFWSACFLVGNSLSWKPRTSTAPVITDHPHQISTLPLASPIATLNSALTAPRSVPLGAVSITCACFRPSHAPNLLLLTKWDYAPGVVERLCQRDSPLRVLRLQSHSSLLRDGVLLIWDTETAETAPLLCPPRCTGLVIYPMAPSTCHLP